MKKIDVIGKFVLIALAAALFAGCGSESPAPLGASIVVTPEKIDAVGAAAGACDFTGTITYTPFTITVFGSNGRTVAYVDVDYSLDFTTETSTSSGGGLDYQRIYLGGAIPPTTPLPGAGRIRTDISGQIELVIATDIDCPHTGDFSVHSGSATAKSTITVAPVVP
jgi:hypothetical protein